MSNDRMLADVEAPIVSVAFGSAGGGRFNPNNAPRNRRQSCSNP
jgi:hypothetical protein